MADILNLDDYRDLPSGKITVTLFGSPFQLMDGSPKRLTYSVTIEHSDFEKLVAHGQQSGGFYMPENGTMWFLPWPPAAIQIHVAADPT